MGCIQSSQPSINDITEDGIQRFKVYNNTSISHEPAAIFKSGILEVTEQELVFYQRKMEPVKWSFKCLRRYGLGGDTFLFESGRRCQTGPGIFAFRCRPNQAEVLHNVFYEKLHQFSLHGNRSRRQTNNIGGFTAPTQIRYSEGVTRPANVASDELVYLVPNQSCPNGNGNAAQYINNISEEHRNHNYMNDLTNPERDRNGLSVDISGSVITPVRELNYAELDLPKSDAIGFPDHSSGKSNKSNVTDRFQLVSINTSSDDDDDAFLPSTPTKTHTSYINMLSANGVTGSSQSQTSYVNIDGAHSQSNGVRQIPNGGGESQTKTDKGDKTPSCIQYVKIDFQKTAAIASTASTYEGLRKTRHDSSAENLN